MKEVSTRFIGSCPVCEGEFKLTEAPHEMVLHGYKRPGDGHAHGQCFGVGAKPYELSAEGCEHYKAYLIKLLEGCEKHLAKLEAGEIKEYPWERRSTGRIEWVYVPDLRFDDCHRRAVSETKYRVGNYKAGIERMERLIAAWKPAPVRTIEEATAALAAAAEVRKGEREAARAAKRAKAAATAAKKAEFEAKRQAVRDSFKARFLAAGSKEAALEIARELRKKKFEFVGLDELGINEELVALGLLEAHRNEHIVHGHTVYYYSAAAKMATR